MRAAVLDDWDPDWGTDAVGMIITLSHRLPQFTSDDLRAAIRPPNRPAQVGAAFRHAQAAGLIESIGYVPSTTTTRNSGRHLQWRRKLEGVQ